jgi:glucokinase
MPTPFYLALDFGGTKHAAALLVPGARAWLAQRRAPAPPGSDGATDRAVMFQLADDLLRQHPGELAAIGVSFGGPVDWAAGRVILSHHVPGWEDTPLTALLRARYGAPVALDNDANAAALGEWRFGAGQGAASLLYVTVSTGIGGGWVLGGQIYRGADSLAGEIGHLALDPAGPACVCGKRGCVEAIGSGTNIARLMNERDGGRAWTAADVNAAAEAGHVAAREVLAAAARALGQGLGYAITLMNPEKIVIGGGVAGAGPFYWGALREAAAAYVLPEMRARTAENIGPAGLGGDSPLWGAVALAEAEVDDQAGRDQRPVVRRTTSHSSAL